MGRADRLGLAVSLVAVPKEAVWYHTCNKARGVVCKNRKLVDAGGCLIWQNAQTTDTFSERDDVFLSIDVVRCSVHNAFAVGFAQILSFGLRQR